MDLESYPISFLGFRVCTDKVELKYTDLTFEQKDETLCRDPSLKTRIARENVSVTFTSDGLKGDEGFKVSFCLI